LPMVFGMIGPAAFPHIAGFLADRSNPKFPVSTAIEGLKKIAERHPECRAECVGILARTLEWHADCRLSERGPNRVHKEPDQRSTPGHREGDSDEEYGHWPEFM
jgi:hypothetical protein